MMHVLSEIISLALEPADWKILLFFGANKAKLLMNAMGASYRR